MSLHIIRNPDGSITVTCDSDSVTIKPDGSIAFGGGPAPPIKGSPPSQPFSLIPRPGGTQVLEGPKISEFNAVHVGGSDEIVEMLRGLTSQQADPMSPLTVRWNGTRALNVRSLRDAAKDQASMRVQILGPNTETE